MNRLSGLSDQPAQVSQLALDDGTLATFALEYRSNQLGWFMNLSYGGFVLNGQRLVTSPNCLNQYQNQIPFGLMCATVGNVEPLGQEAFVDGTTTLYLLNQQDVVLTSSLFFGSSDTIT